MPAASTIIKPLLLHWKPSFFPTTSSTYLAERGIEPYTPSHSYINRTTSHLIYGLTEAILYQYIYNSSYHDSSYMTNQARHHLLNQYAEPQTYIIMFWNPSIQNTISSSGQVFTGHIHWPPAAWPSHNLFLLSHNLKFLLSLSILMHLFTLHDQPSPYIKTSLNISSITSLLSWSLRRQLSSFYDCSQPRLFNTQRTLSDLFIYSHLVGEIHTIPLSVELLQCVSKELVTMYIFYPSNTASLATSIPLQHKRSCYSGFQKEELITKHTFYPSNAVLPCTITHTIKGISPIAYACRLSLLTTIQKKKFRITTEDLKFQNTIIHILRSCPHVPQWLTPINILSQVHTLTNHIQLKRLNRNNSLRPPWKTWSPQYSFMYLAVLPLSFALNRINSMCPQLCMLKSVYISVV